MRREALESYFTGAYGSAGVVGGAGDGVSGIAIGESTLPGREASESMRLGGRFGAALGAVGTLSRLRDVAERVRQLVADCGEDTGGAYGVGGGTITRRARATCCETACPPPRRAADFRPKSGLTAGVWSRVVTGRRR